MTRRIVVGVAGSSAPQLGLAVLHALRETASCETHLVLSPGARRSIEVEMGTSPRVFERLADVVHAPHDLCAPIATTTFDCCGMIVVPCSMRTLAAIATGNATDLLSTAADACLATRKRLLLVTRETPLNLIHIGNMAAVASAGGIIMPPVPAVRRAAQQLDDLLRSTADRILDVFGLPRQLPGGCDVTSRSD